MNQKTLVRYADLDPRLVRNLPARLIPIDHPNKSLNGFWVRTSPVLHFRPGLNGPIIETKFTIYTAGETDESMPATSARKKAQPGSVQETDQLKQSRRVA